MQVSRHLYVRINIIKANYKNNITYLIIYLNSSLYSTRYSCSYLTRFCYFCYSYCLRHCLLSDHRMGMINVAIIDSVPMPIKVGTRHGFCDLPFENALK